MVPVSDDIMNRIRKLQATASHENTTENEAKIAAQKAAKLMAEYNLTLADISLEEEDMVMGHQSVGHKQTHMVINCVAAIAEFTDTRVWKSRTTVVYFGLEPDVAIAKYLTSVIHSALETEWGLYKKTETYKENKKHGKSLRTSFMIGMCCRLNERMRQIKRAEQPIQHNTGTALVVVKKAAVDEAFKDLGVNLKKGVKRTYSTDQRAQQAGYQAGENVSLNKAIQ